ncbi:hypothetical protein RhiirA4_449069 [Rhizophagus irregularis]|uniref:Uncharacterized protein n=1 Tax=Rhizophagus irregularis TaxID=588596 RepID=A0A2I1HFF5_9GLOM|nr:hypothetical protein RhiirA4_449069 [Rhizophagus irregularis]
MVLPSLCNAKMVHHRDKSLEHQFYVQDLEYLQKNPEEYQQAEQAERCLLNFQLEKMSEDVNTFWLSVDMKKQIDVKKLECAGNALDAIANETRLRSVLTNEVISIVGSSQEHNSDKDQGETSRNVSEDSNICLMNNENAIIENIDEKTLKDEDKLPPASGNKDPPKIRADVLDAFRIYQKKIPKIRRVFTKVNMHSFQGMLTEEQLKMTTSFPLFMERLLRIILKMSARMGRKVNMKATLTKTLNKFEVIYGEVAGGLGPFGIPSACQCKHVTDESRRNIIIYGWLQVGLELNFYVMDWQGNGIYRFGLIDQCRIPVDEDDCGNLEDAYCVLKSLESKSLETEKVVKELFSENTKGKRRQIAPETEAELNTNRTPQK